jgi:hypothetical protein
MKSRVEVDVFVAAVELGGNVVAQPLGVHAQAQVLQRVKAGAAALAHLLAVVHRQKAVHKHWLGTLRPLKCSMAGQNSVWKVMMSLPMKWYCSTVAGRQ